MKTPGLPGFAARFASHGLPPAPSLFPYRCLSRLSLARCNRRSSPLQGNLATGPVAHDLAHCVTRVASLRCCLLPCKRHLLRIYVVVPRLQPSPARSARLPSGEIEGRPLQNKSRFAAIMQTCPVGMLTCRVDPTFACSRNSLLRYWLRCARFLRRYRVPKLPELFCRYRLPSWPVFPSGVEVTLAHGLDFRHVPSSRGWLNIVQALLRLFSAREGVPRFSTI